MIILLLAIFMCVCWQALLLNHLAKRIDEFLSENVDTDKEIENETKN